MPITMSGGNKMVDWDAVDSALKHIIESIESIDDYENDINLLNEVIGNYKELVKTNAELSEKYDSLKKKYNEKFVEGMGTHVTDTGKVVREDTKVYRAEEYDFWGVNE